MKDYLAFFTNWLGYQFSHKDEETHRNLILSVVKEKFITTDEEASYWGHRDCWTMYDLANKVLQQKYKYNA